MSRTRKYDYNGKRVKSGLLEILCDGCGKHHERYRMRYAKGKAVVLCRMCLVASR